MQFQSIKKNQKISLKITSPASLASYQVISLSVSQLFSITHEIYKSFDCHLPPDIRGKILDISKEFDKVWHEGLIFKLKNLWC